jgi:thiol-disulfide isomerase/thioredoxin
MEILTRTGIRAHRIWWAIFVVICLAGSAAAENGARAAAAPCRPQPDTEPVMLAAQTLDGASTDLAALRGRPVLIDVWATWCSACRTTLVAVNDLAANPSTSDLVVVGLSVDRNLEDARVWLQETLGKPALLGWQANPSEAFAALDIRALPATVLLDAKGRFVARHEGSDPAELEELLTQARACGQTSG